jgi:hypothetical protein
MLYLFVLQHVWIYRILLKVLGIVQIDGGNFARPTVIRLTRVGKTPEYNVGDCVVCRLNLLKFLIDFTLANSRKSFFLGKELDASIKLANDLFVTLTIIYIIKDVIFFNFCIVVFVRSVFYEIRMSLLKFSYSKSRLLSVKLYG